MKELIQRSCKAKYLKLYKKARGPYQVPFSITVRLMKNPAASSGVSRHCEEPRRSFYEGGRTRQSRVFLVALDRHASLTMTNAASCGELNPKVIKSKS
ncbi:MAG: hypothetical protein KAJ40_04305 [Alphaproteobacteria bacterium]|nr:hypothetical protein [Alphaproteobacteria bacterium]